MNYTLFQILHGIKSGSACGITHLKQKYFWFGIQINKMTHCFPTEVWHEKVRRLNPLLFEWDVTSSQNTSGHSINNPNAGIWSMQLK